MAKKFMDLVRSVLPLGDKQKLALEQVSKYLEKEDIVSLKSLLKQKRVSIVDSKLDISPQLLDSSLSYTFHADSTERSVKDFIESVNKRILDSIMERSYIKFSKKANEIVPKFIAMNIRGFNNVKKAAALQLFATEPIHILLLGDPGTGKTDIIRSAANLHKISSFGLGSGTSGAGLTATVKGKEISEGLLPKANKGICAIDELNLMEDKDRGSLYNAMEKGFVTYDKGGQHHRFEAKVRVLATANPKGDRFAGKTVESLKQQLPFDSALLTRFHLIFLIRKPDLQQFKEISRKILRGDKVKKGGGDEKFIQGYVSYAENVKVKIPKKFEQEIVDFVADIKANEKNYLIEVSPRIVIGFTRLAKAAARMRLGTEVKEEDIKLVKEIVTEGLKLEAR